MQNFIPSHKKLLLACLIIATIAIGIMAGIYIHGRYSVKTETTFKNEYNLVLKDYSGKDVSLSDFKGKFIIVSAWASWCPYCKAEIENLSKLLEMYPGKLHIIAVNRAEPLSDAKTFSDTLQVSKDVRFLLDTNDSFFKEMGGFAMPETAFIDQYGHVLFRARGPMTMDEMTQKVKELIR